MRYAPTPEKSRFAGRRVSTKRSIFAAGLLGAACLVSGELAIDSPTFPALDVVSGQAVPLTAASPLAIAGLLNPQSTLGLLASRQWAIGPVPAGLTVTSGQTFASAQPVPTTPVAESGQVAPSPSPRDARLVPLPVPRPAEFVSLPPSLAEPRTARRTRSAALEVPAPDSRSFLEKLFNVPASPAPAATYAALGSGALDLAPARPPALAPSPTPGAGTAIYDISTRTVVLPNGDTLEAHSGIGEKLDDPRFVHVRMRGATPPGTYALTEREELFHGVRALRLSPVGGAGAIFGRAGLLAHSFMLGPNGDSNGCVSFRDYDRFLQAYLKGEVQRLVVVTGRGRENQPGILNRLFGMPQTPMVPGPNPRDA